MSPHGIAGPQNQSSPKFREEMSIGQTSNYAKFCGDTTISVRDIRDRKFVLPKKVGQNSPKSLKTYYPLKLPIMPNFIKMMTK